MGIILWSYRVIISSFGINSINRIGTGDYRVVFLKQFKSYPAVSATAEESYWRQDPKIFVRHGGSPTPTVSIRLSAVNSAGSYSDPQIVTACFVGKLL